MSYIVPSELPKSCSCCPFCYLIMQNPLSSKTPIKRYRCQVGKAPWRTFDVDFYNGDEYKDKDCPLVPMQEIVGRIENVRDNVRSTSFKNGCNASLYEICKEVGGMND